MDRQAPGSYPYSQHCHWVYPARANCAGRTKYAGNKRLSEQCSARCQQNSTFPVAGNTRTIGRKRVPRRNPGTNRTALWDTSNPYT